MSFLLNTILLALVLALATPAARAADVELKWDDIDTAARFAQEAGIQAKLYEGDAFRIIHIGRSSWPTGLQKLLNQTRRHFYATFEEHGFSLADKHEPLTWICFDRRADYEYYTWNADMMRQDMLDGYYSEWTNRVALVYAPPANRQPDRESNVHGDVHEHDPALGTPARIAAHEAIHQLSYNCGILTRGVAYPLWVTEGMATAMEVMTNTKTPLSKSNEMRRQRLLAAHQAGQLIPLNEFLHQTRAPRELNVARVAYAQSWGIYCMMMERYPNQLQGYLAKLSRQDPGPRGSQLMMKELTLAFGDVSALEDAWSSFLAELAPTPRLARP